MKLKKIAALALAGVMAVSMLAGCGTDKKPGTGEGEGEGPVTTTGYSAELGKIMDLGKDYISFADNASDEAALKTALGYLTSKNITSIMGSTGWGSNTQVWNSAPGTVANQLTTLLKDDLKLVTSMEWLDINKDQMVSSDGVKDAVLYFYDGAVSDEAILNQLAEQTQVKNIAKQAESSSNNIAVKAEYTYTVSVSIAHKVVGDNDIALALVSVTRDSNV